MDAKSELKGAIEKELKKGKRVAKKKVKAEGKKIKRSIRRQKKQVEKSIDNKIDDTTEMIHDFSDVAHDEISSKLKDLSDQYELDVRKEEITKAVNEVEDFVKKHPLAGLALAAAGGYIISSLFHKKN